MLRICHRNDGERLGQRQPVQGIRQRYRAVQQRGRMISPVTVTCISSDGSGKSAKIEITAAKPVMQ